MKITANAVKAMVYEKDGRAADYRWDDELKGFGVRVYPSGRRAFVVAYRNETNTKRFLTLGDFGELTVQQARDLARDKLVEVRQGHDPQADRQEKRKETTFKEFGERYIDHAKHHKRSWEKDAQRLRDHILPKIGSRKLSEVTVHHCNDIHTSVKKALSPATANRVLALLRHMLNTAVKWGLLETAPTKHLKMFQEAVPRDTVLTPEQCHRVLDACDADDNVFAASLFKLAMFTGRRVGELLAAKWEHLDIKSGVLTLPQTKAGERQFAYLNEAAVAVLRTLPRIEGNPYIIAGEATGKPLNFYRRAWLRIIKRADVPYFPPHGLRHNYASLLVAAGVPLETVGHLLGHKHSVTTRRYAHHQPANLRRAAETFSNVVDLDAMRAKKTGTEG